MNADTSFQLNCPVPFTEGDQVLMAHGGGGRLMGQLIAGLFLPAFANPHLEAQHDGAVVEAGGARLAFSTDSYVVQPLFFPGGDIGSLAVHGTVNDLSMCGAQPLYLSAGFIVEEGLPMEILKRVVQSMGQAAREAGVQLVTGDTKVVDQGKGDGLFINTAGIGLVREGADIGPHRIAPDDAVLISGDLGRHGMAIMAQRQGLAFEHPLESDSASLAAMVGDLLTAGVEVHCLRDLTRGGLASALVELSQSAQVDILVEEAAIPVHEAVRGACEILGLDPMYVANEGRCAVFVPAAAAPQALEILHRHQPGAGAVQIGRVAGADRAQVRLLSPIGVERLVDQLSGEQLPRIC
ncbi:MAG: hydrogenase expression/formation protein HypE [Candidatus Latescibacteria bacterium]|nr:hydrogenase expression/formation protein HypE [Candidatus Latescibacterota bacterium]